MLYFLSMGQPVHIALIYLITLVLAISVHEAAHGWMALKLGDPTARNLGKITIDPRAHFTKFSLLMMLVFPIGFGSSPINPRNFSKPSRDERLVALAGPVSNLLLGFFSLVVMSAIAVFIIPFGSAFFTSWIQLMSIILWINVWLFILNLIPIPPLDGFQIIAYLVPWKAREYFYRIERYGFLLLILVINLFSGSLEFLMDWIINGMYGLIPWV